VKNKVVFGYDELWGGHKLMEGHSALAHVQMDTCVRATEVLYSHLSAIRCLRYLLIGNSEHIRTRMACGRRMFSQKEHEKIGLHEFITRSMGNYRSTYH
jgi:hypothetical protein